MVSLPANVLAAVFDFLPIEEAASVSGAKRFKYRRIFQACVQGRRLFMQTSYQNQLALVRDIDIEYTSLFASLRVVALREEHAALFLGRDAAPNARAVQQTRITHVILPTFEEVCHAQHGAMHSCF